MNRLAFLSKELNPICCSAQFMCSLERLEFPQCCALMEINSKRNNSWAVWGGWRKTLHRTPPDWHGSHPFILSSWQSLCSGQGWGDFPCATPTCVPEIRACWASRKKHWVTPVTQPRLLWWTVTRPLKSQRQPFCSERLHKLTELCVHSTCCILTFRSRIYEEWVFPRKLLVYSVSFWEVDEISGSLCVSLIFDEEEDVDFSYLYKNWKEFS